VKGERVRQSPFPMISVDDAIKILFEQAYRMPIVDKSLTGKKKIFACFYLIFCLFVFQRMFGIYLCRRSYC